MNPQQYLCRDSHFAPWIEHVGDYQLVPTKFDTAFHPLCRSIVYQQLSGKAAATIYGRVAERFGDGDRVDPALVCSASMEDLRSVGLSNAKARYVQALAQTDQESGLPSSRELDLQSDEEVLDALTQHKGVGRWTAQMIMMFWMARADVFAPDDLGLRKGIQKLDGLESMPSIDYMLGRSQVWRPWRTYASWYLWRMLETDLPLAV